jgi:hypothetical protein
MAAGAVSLIGSAELISQAGQMTNQNAPFLIEGQPRFAAGTPPFHGCLSLSQENRANAPNTASELHKTCARPWDKLVYFSKKSTVFCRNRDFLVFFHEFICNANCLRKLSLLIFGKSFERPSP